MINNKIYIGINVGQHDSSACVLNKNQNNDFYNFTIFEEERFTKNKRAGYYPFLSVYNIQKLYNLNNLPDENVAFTSFLTGPKETIEYSNKKSSKYKQTIIPLEKLLVSNDSSTGFTHHEAHLFSTLPFIRNIENEDYFVVVADGIGSNFEEVEKNSIFPLAKSENSSYCESISIYKYKNRNITQVDKILYNPQIVYDQIGNTSPATYFTCASLFIFGHWAYSGKVMGLASYHKGDLFSEKQLQDIFTTESLKTRVISVKFEDISAEKIELYMKISASVQNIFEDYFFNLVQGVKASDPEVKNIALTGGCALNCIFNEKLRKTGMFETIFVPPWPNDEGVSLGCTIGNYYKHHAKLPKVQNPTKPFRGKSQQFTIQDVENTFKAYKINSFDIKDIVSILIKNEIIAVFRGKSECGPRALGHRSIICSPFIKDIKNYLNTNIKFRENFRPYGCSILADDVEKYFEDSKGLTSPYMSFAPIVRKEFREHFKEVIHVDNSIRIQTVTKDFHFLYELLTVLNEETGDSAIIHTSLNINTQPILETLSDALKFFNSSKIKYMVINNHLITK